MLFAWAPSRPTRLPLQSSGETTRKELALGRKYSIIPNPLILPSTGHTGDLRDAQLQSGDAQLQSGDPRRSSRLDLPRDLVLEMLSRLNLLRDPLVPGVPGGRHASICPGTQFLGGHHTSTCPGIRSLGGCHTSASLGICTLTRGCLALRLQLFWIGQASERLTPKEVHSWKQKEAYYLWDCAQSQQ